MPVLTFSLIVIIPFLIIVCSLEVYHAVDVSNFVDTHSSNDKRYPGKPDIILPKYKAAIYINGCFWHMHDCPNFVWPKSNTDYWTNKLIKNKNRDKNYYEQMKERGWHVIVVWECEINEKRLDKLIKEIKAIPVAIEKDIALN